MDELTDSREALQELRPLDASQLQLLFPRWSAEDAIFVYNTNAIEGSTLTQGETTVVLETGVTIGGKPIKDHLDAVNGASAYRLMLDLAQKRDEISLATILRLHAVVVGESESIAGQVRDEPVYIRGSMHVPPNHVKVPRMLDEMMARYTDSQAVDHPVAIAAALHFDLLTIHPFKDGNGRTARLVQNLHLIREGYAPVLIAFEEKPKYFDILQKAQIAVPGVGDARTFVDYIVSLETKAMQRYLSGLEA